MNRSKRPMTYAVCENISKKRSVCVHRTLELLYKKMSVYYFGERQGENEWKFKNKKTKK